MHEVPQLTAKLHAPTRYRRADRRHSAIGKRRPPVLLFWLALFTALNLLSARVCSASFPDSAVQELHLPHIAAVDILALDATIKDWLDTYIAPIKRSTTRATLLHIMLFDRAYRGIRYDGTRTKTALQTWYSGSGNCVSLASLYVASARYVGLNAKFQAVKVPREWYEKEGFYLIPGHVNAAIKLPRDNVTVEFTDIYPASETQHFQSKKISDKRMLAEYYNNIGMELLAEGQADRALAYLVKAIDTAANVDFIWSNLGVAFKLRAQYPAAEKAYKKALRLQGSNLSTLNNLYVLYMQTQQEEAAKKLRKKVQRYSRRNPFYLYRLAITEQKLNNYDAAKNLLRQALVLKPEKAKFHLLMGQLHFQTGDWSASREAIAEAKRLSENQADMDRYQRKIDAIERLRANL